MSTDADPPALPDTLAQFVAQSRIALSLADAQRPDCPLVAVSPAFCDLAQYAAAEVLGRNCRFLQPPGGAGPVRAGMRRFIDDPAAREERFVVPNQRKDGERFLNLVYMAKLARNGRTALILGSQFDMNRHRIAPDAYDAALRADLRTLGGLAREDNLVTLGTFASLATSHSIIAQARLDG